MKVAQFVATVPGVLPPEVAAPLLTLQTNAPPMGAGFVRRRMAAELGPDWEKKFKRFEREAAAAASLGQVHRAVAKDGTLLACKLQYPDMGAAVESDIRQFKAALRLQRGFDSTIDTREIGEEIAARLAEELDYVREAAHMRLYALMLKDRSDIAVPDPVAALSTKRLLTMSWLEGWPVLDFETAPLKTRNVIATALFKAWWRPFARYGVIHGDPHLGNYMVRADGGINLLDYGCIRTFTPAFVEGVVGLYRALQTRTTAYLPPKPIAPGALRRSRRSWWTSSTCGRASSSRLCSTIACASSMTACRPPNTASSRPTRCIAKLKALGGIRPPREFVFMDRAAIGLGGALIRLGARLNFHELFEEEIADFDVAELAQRQRAVFKKAGVPLPDGA